MRNASSAHQSLEEAEKSIVLQFRAEALPDDELTQSYQEIIDAMRSLTYRAIQEMSKDSAAMPSREWELLEGIISGLESLRNEIRDVLGNNYLIGGIFFDKRTYDSNQPITLCFAIHEAGSGDAEFDPLVCMDGDNDFPTLSRRHRSGLRAPGDAIPIRKRPFSEDMLEWLK